MGNEKVLDLQLTWLESTLLLGPENMVIPAQTHPDAPFPACRIVKAALPTRRRVGIEEFESDMRAVFSPTPQGSGR